MGQQYVSPDPGLGITVLPGGVSNLQSMAAGNNGASALAFIMLSSLSQGRVAQVPTWLLNGPLHEDTAPFSLTNEPPCFLRPTCLRHLGMQIANLFALCVRAAYLVLCGWGCLSHPLGARCDGCASCNFSVRNQFLCPLFHVHSGGHSSCGALHTGRKGLFGGMMVWWLTRSCVCIPVHFPGNDKQPELPESL